LLNDLLGERYFKYGGHRGLQYSMTVYNFGSINADYFYQVPHIPAPGETLAAMTLERGLGGKGANQSVAMVKAGADVVHIGAVGVDGQWLLDRLEFLGVDAAAIEQLDCASGHGIINVSADGENAITLFQGANVALGLDRIQAALGGISAHDWLVLQNETSHQRVAAELANAKGARVVYSAAPFDAQAVADVLPFVDVLCVNEPEAKALEQASQKSGLEDLGVGAMLITYGALGAVYHDFVAGKVTKVEGIKVTPVDTTGAGDTFCGYFVGRLSLGDDPQTALLIANQAAALKVTRPGTADAIPGLAEVLAISY
jgi:ribokinase